MKNLRIFFCLLLTVVNMPFLPSVALAENWSFATDDESGLKSFIDWDYSEDFRSYNSVDEAFIGTKLTQLNNSTKRHHYTLQDNGLHITNESPGATTEWIAMQHEIDRFTSDESAVFHYSFQIRNDDNLIGKAAQIYFHHYDKYGNRETSPVGGTFLTFSTNGTFTTPLTIVSGVSNAAILGKIYKVDYVINLNTRYEELYIDGAKFATRMREDLITKFEGGSVRLSWIRHTYGATTGKICSVWYDKLRYKFYDKNTTSDQIISAPIEIEIDYGKSIVEVRYFNPSAATAKVYLALYGDDGRLTALTTSGGVQMKNGYASLAMSLGKHFITQFAKLHLWHGGNFSPITTPRQMSPLLYCSARVRIDNTLEFQWNTADSVGKYINIYASDDNINFNVIKTKISAQQKEYIVDLIPNKIDSGSITLEYNNFYKFVITNDQDEFLGETTVEVKLLAERRGKEVTNLEHPFLLATDQTIENTKEKIKQHDFYLNEFHKTITACDSFVEKYKNFTGPFTKESGSSPGVTESTNAAAAVAVLGVGYVLLDGEMYALLGDKLADQEQEQARLEAAQEYSQQQTEKYAETAYKLLKAFSDYYSNDTSGTNYLFDQNKDDSNLVTDLAEGYDLIYQALTTTQRTEIEQGYFRNVLNRMLAIKRGSARDQGQIDWSILTIGILLKDQEIYDIGWRNTPSYGVEFNALNGIGDDGMWWEQSMSYHSGRTSLFLKVAEYMYNCNYDLYNYHWQGERMFPADGSGSIYPADNVSRYVSVEKQVTGKSIEEMVDAMFYFAVSNMEVPSFGDASRPNRLTNTYIYDIYEKAWSRYNHEKSGWILARDYGWNRSKNNSNSYSTGVYKPTDIFLSKPELPKTTPAIGNEPFAVEGYSKLGSSVFNGFGAAVLRSQGSINESTNLSLQWCNYGTVAHSHGDKLGIILHSKGREILADLGRNYAHATQQQQYLKHTIAHNTVTVDEQSQDPYRSSNANFVSDGSGQFTGGRLVELSIGPFSRAVKMENKNVYRFRGVELSRTLWQIDDYAIDVFNCESFHSEPTHKYDYPLTINGNLTGLSVAGQPHSLTPVENTSTALGTAFGYQHIRRLSNASPGDSLWTSDWSIKGTGSTVYFRTTMLGGVPTDVVKGSGLGNSANNYDVDILVARRTAKDTDFITVLEPTKNIGDFKTITPVQQLPTGVQAITLLHTSGIKDTFIFSKIPSTSVEQMETDAQSAFRRVSSEGEDIVLACIEGTKLKAGDIEINTNTRTSFQFTKLDNSCYRLDMGEKDTMVTLSGFDGYDIFEMELDNNVSLKPISINNGALHALKRGIYIIAKDGAQNLVHQPQTVPLG